MPGRNGPSSAAPRAWPTCWYKEDGELAGPVAKNLTDFERAGLAEAVGAKPGDCIFFAAGDKTEARALLGAARVEIGHRTGLIKRRRLGLRLGC